MPILTITIFYFLLGVAITELCLATGILDKSDRDGWPILVAGWPVLVALLGTFFATWLLIQVLYGLYVLYKGTF